MIQSNGVISNPTIYNSSDLSELIKRQISTAGIIGVKVRVFALTTGIGDFTELTSALSKNIQVVPVSSTSEIPKDIGTYSIYGVPLGDGGRLIVGTTGKLVTLVLGSSSEVDKLLPRSYLN